MARRAPNLLRDDRGATAVEYGLIVALVVLAMLVALFQLASTTINMWDGIADRVIEKKEQSPSD